LVIGKSLPEINGIMLIGKPTHDSKNRSGGIGEFGLNVQFEKFINKNGCSIGSRAKFCISFDFISP